MSVLTQIERRSFAGRCFLLSVILSLVLGGLTMVYPFLLMVAGSISSPMDISDMGLVPDYLVDDSDLVRKFLEYKYNHNTSVMNELRGYQDYSFEQATVPEAAHPQRLADLRRFAAEVEIPDHWWVLGGTQMYRRTSGPNKARFTRRVRQLYDDDLGTLRAELGVAVTKWRDLGYLLPQHTSRRYDPQQTRYDQAYRELLGERPLAERAFVSISGPYLSAVVFPAYGRTSVDPYNAAHEQDIAAFGDLAIARTCPPASQPKLRAEWLTFVRQLLNSSFIRTTADDASYRNFLIERYGSIADLNRAWASDYPGFGAIALPADTQWLSAAVRVDYRAFLDTVPDEALYLVGPEFAWRDWLTTQYADLDAVRTAHGTDYADWMQVRLPMAELESAHVRDHATALRWQFATSNYKDVIDEVIVQGRPFLNTLVYVGLSLLLTLTLQPLAAYALSRFSPPGTWRLILIFMATMAFPPMVGLIPQFLILRQLNLLNTFIALTLPIIVNGYLIFLLKGFFDSLPHHLYEAALIDGASELRMFWEITMALSRPILAVVALQTFNHAWIAFMYPLLVCPDESMHVLAVWLYQFQNEAPTSAVFAAIVVTSIPTLLLFVLTQRTIMRGIAVPAEK